MQEISQDIIVKASEGDPKSFESIYRATADFVYNVALRIVNNREDAEEVTQEIFMIIYRKLNSFRFESSFKTWVYRITVNNAVNFARKTSKTRNKTTEYDEALEAGSMPAEIEAHIDQEHQKKTIEELL